MEASAPLLQRADGAARVSFARRDGVTRLADLYQRDPARVLFPDPDPGQPPEAVVLTTSGGLTDGDRVALEIETGPETEAVVTTQAAEKIYRAAGLRHVAIDVAVRVATGAQLDWLPQETIVFDGARVKRRTVADVEVGGRLLACEAVVLGRAWSGERFRRGLLLDRWTVRRSGREIWTDALRLEGDMPGAAGFGAANALATVIGVCDAPQPELEHARALLTAVPAEVRTGVTSVNSVIVARLLGEAGAVRRALVPFLSGWRGRKLPRVWHT